MDQMLRLVFIKLAFLLTIAGDISQTERLFAEATEVDP
jgi:hypothetical protein